MKTTIVMQQQGNFTVFTAIARREWSKTCLRDNIKTRVVPSKRGYNRRANKHAIQGD
jgi:hypothetical protein